MSYSKAEIIRAVEVINNVCHDSKYCCNCPFCHGDSECYINNVSPMEWEIIPREALKLFN